jgi:hypothetical protein
MENGAVGAAAERTELYLRSQIIWKDHLDLLAQSLLTPLPNEPN